MSKRPALGRGLASLIPEVESSVPARLEPVKVEPEGERVLQISVDKIDAGRYQPRSEFADEALHDLAESIREKGVLQPLIVRPVGDRFELIAGERRLRASKRVGLEKVPVILRVSSDGESLELALIENIQRENLNAIELARAFKQLQDEFGYTQEEISKRVGKDRSTITNHLRLLKLSEPVKLALSSDVITMGHARALLGLDDAPRQEQALKTVVDRSLSVRETEELVKRLREARPPKKPGQKPASSPELDFVTDRLRRTFQTRVDIQPRKKGGGEIRIEYYSDEELNRILELLPES
ncbi:MAG: ParB/RepB/Spo0J family partition protein [Myxococcota bacterium]